MATTVELKHLNPEVRTLLTQFLTTLQQGGKISVSNGRKGLIIHQEDFFVYPRSEEFLGFRPSSENTGKVAITGCQALRILIDEASKQSQYANKYTETWLKELAKLDNSKAWEKANDTKKNK